MGKNFREYPELVGMDTTYCVNKNQMPLVVFRVTDCHGQGKPAGYCFVASKKIDIMRKSVMTFKQANADSIELVQTIVVDKDYNEVTVLKELLPSVHIHLCSVHVLEAFKRNSKDEVNKDKIREVLQNIVYALTHRKYMEYLEELKDEASPTFMEYFNKYWAEYGTAWSCYERLNSLNLGQRTNNSVESHNKNIKSLMSKRSSLVELVKGLLVLQDSSDAVTNYKDFLGIMKMSYRTDTAETLMSKRF
ncbi:uncharacterized protein LOC113211292 [Frankliniella occidentalis]|uniref:Uncharacterized protein LOC113211292 n=1 Tax=Frankliniella occidentalis TaxID=133901 RepID=A0A6J1T1E9_FRAOC|nr:uncharacterized protein LOC113211292 [Frankliniella occidentalis]